MATQTAAGAGDPDPAPAASRTLPTDRWLPGLGHIDCRFLHWVPAGTEQLPDWHGQDHYRAACGAECLRMPVGALGVPYEYESLPHHEDCRSGVERED